MRKIREVLRLKFECGCSQRQIAASCDISVGVVAKYLARAAEARLSWQEAAQLSEADVDARLFRPPAPSDVPVRTPIDFEWVHRELRKTGVTLQLLWVEYHEAASRRGAAGYQYSQFCELYANWRSKLSVTMRQVHRAGEKAFVDYSGKKPHIVDSKTGEVTPVELFLTVLGASNYTFAEATRTQGLDDFVASTVRSFSFFGCVPHVLVPDQLRSAVSGPDRYEPEINPTYLEMAQHYGVAVVPARPRKPRDKAKVEAGVLLAQRWILARLRHRTFFDLAELNTAIAELVDGLNRRPFQKLEGCRRSAFESIDRPAMRPLPLLPYEKASWNKAKVNVDYHVDFDNRLYSVPHTLVGARVEIRATMSTVEILHRGERVASHRRSYGSRGTAVTREEHRPQSHRDYGKWPPERMIGWAGSFGPAVARVARQLLARYPHPEMGYRAVLGLVRCADKHGAARTDAACERALLAAGPWGPTRKQIEAMLKAGLERRASIGEQRPLPIIHDNVRGAGYFDKEAENAIRRNHSEVDSNEALHHV